MQRRCNTDLNQEGDRWNLFFSICHSLGKGLLQFMSLQLPVIANCHSLVTLFLYMHFPVIIK